MADVFYTILIVWVLWKIFGKSSVKTYSSNHQQASKKKEGETTVSYDKKKNNKQNDDGEYIDYEEIK